jgi:hypothetical protein
MLHSVEELAARIDVIRDKAQMLVAVRTEFLDHPEKQYDADTCKILLDEIQSMALLIGKDRQGVEIMSDMDK